MYSKGATFSEQMQFSYCTIFVDISEVRREKVQELLYGIVTLFSSVLVHENERRFACEECGKKFGESKVIKIPGFFSFYSQNVKCLGTYFPSFCINDVGPESF